MGLLKGWSGWRRYRKLSADWRNIVFYSESGQDWHYFEPLIAVLNADLNRKVTYVTSDRADPGLHRQNDLFTPIHIPPGIFLTLHFNLQKADVVVLTMMDLDNFQLKKSINPVHYIYLFHSLGSTHMVDHANSYDAYDSLFCVGPHHVEELRKRESMTGLKARNLFEYGHPRLESLVVAAQSYQQNLASDPASADRKPVVLIAPTWGEQSIFNTCGDELTATLLDAGYHVIVRPHYQTLQLTPEVMENLKAKYAGRDNFEYQDRMGESDTLFRSDVLVCDWSAMAIEYALGLEKPVLFVDLPRRVRNPDWQAFDIEPREVAIRELAGDILSPSRLAEAPDKIARLIDAQDEFRQRMQNLRTQMVFNIGGSIAAGAGEIARLADENASRQRAGESQDGR
ncbi:MAG: CDP-glycerol glycerophosphotransferase family protein [Gammaproteobacteria bacterium]|nr:CDP-glycerol glycerophosphotransferase family protein [Gammaproteobacteria bacterium]